MDHPVDLTLMEQDGNERHVLADFDDDEWRVLHAYLTYVNELAEARLLKAGIPTSLNLHWDAESGLMSVQAELPSWDDVVVVLHKLRPIILEKESTSFPKVRSLLGKRLEDEYIRAFTKQVHDVYSCKKLQSLMKMTVNGDILLNSDEALKIWLNAHEYHRSQKEQEKFEHMTQMITFDGARAILLVVLAEKVKAIFQLAALVANIVGQEKSVSLQVYPAYLNRPQESQGDGGVSWT